MDHIPVLLNEVMATLNPRRGERVLDCTVGLGGHAAAFLERIGSRGILVGVDADEENLAIARERLKKWKNVKLTQGNFGTIVSTPLPNPPPKGDGISGFDIIFADLGLSSPHIDDPKRGFTYRENAPLDLRFDRQSGITAAEFIGQRSEQEIADILFRFGELKESRRLAHMIKHAAPRTTWELKQVIEEAVTWRAPNIFAQVFQALRIAVNDELGALSALLEHGPYLLRPGGRMGVISYHSLEDRMVKHLFRKRSSATFRILTKKPIGPSDFEVRMNPRSRSAKFRAMERRV